jgi:hypothetical protein
MRRLYLALTVILASLSPLAAQDVPLPLPYSEETAGIINRAPFEASPEILSSLQTRQPVSFTVTLFDDSATSCNLTDGITLREALVHCSVGASPAVQPIVYLPAGTYTLNSAITLSNTSFALIGQSPLNTFIVGSSAIRYFDLTSTTSTITMSMVNLTLQDNSLASSGNVIRFAGGGQFYLDNVRVRNNSGVTRGTVRFDVESGLNMYVSVHRSEFSGNSGSSGVGMAMLNELGGTNATLSITNSVFSSNTATTEGAGLLISSVSPSTAVTISGSTFSQNSVPGGTSGGIHMAGNGTPASLSIINSTIANNTTGRHGAGLFLTAPNTNLTIENSIIRDNTITSTFNGAGLYLSSARNVNLTNTLIENNSAPNGIGGGLYMDTGVGHASLSSTRLLNNSAGNAGALYAFLIDNFVGDNLRIEGNSATEEIGGALIASSFFTSLNNSVITLNTAGDEIGGLYVGRAMLTQVKIEDNSAPLSPDCRFDVLSGTVTSGGGVGITNMSGCDGTFVPAAGDQIGNLLRNGGFEFAGAAAIVPANWTRKNLVGDRRICNTTAKTFTPFGKCVLQFTGSTGENAILTQSIDLTSLVFSAGQELRIWAMGDGSKPTSKLAVTLTAQYTDQPANKATVIFSGNHTGLTLQSQILTLASANVSKLTVQLRHTSPSGKFLLDRVYVTR